MGDLSPPKLFIGIAAVLGLIFAFIIETPLSFFAHLVQWQVQTTGAVIFIILTHILLFKLIKTQRLNPWIRVALSGFIGALLFSPIATINDLIFGGDALVKGFQSEWFNEIISTIPPMVITWVAMNAPWLLGYRLWHVTDEANDDTGSKEVDESKNIQQNPSFLSLTKIETANDILYIKSELHYINVITKDSKHLILFSLKEAKTQLDEAEIGGIQCHRGYWVSHTAIDTISRSGREAEFILKNGDIIPISRANVSKCTSLIENVT